MYCFKISYRINKRSLSMIKVTKLDASQETLTTMLAIENNDNESTLHTKLTKEFYAFFTQSFGTHAWQDWGSQITLKEPNPDTQVFTMTVPSIFIKSWVEQHYQETTEDFLKNFFKKQKIKIKSVQIEVIQIEGKNEDNIAKTKTVNTTIAQELTTHTTNFQKEDTWAYQASPIDETRQFDTFMVGKSNELAFASAYRVSESLVPPFNPLYLHGKVGLGKTHLMHAIANRTKLLYPHKKIVYLSAERFMHQFVQAIRFRNTTAFKDHFRSVDLLMIDDIQFISDKESTQEEFFHTFNALVEHNRQVVISADKSPQELKGLEERMQSRLGCGLVTDLYPTTYELRLSILTSKIVSMPEIEIPLNVLEFLAEKITANVRELEGALNRLVNQSLYTKEPITLSMTQECLRDLLRNSQKSEITLDKIHQAVADYFDLKLAAIYGPSREKKYSKPRQIVMFLSKKHTQFSFPDIAKSLNRKDHTTIIHGFRQIEEKIESDAQLRLELQAIERKLFV